MNRILGACLVAVLAGVTAVAISLLSKKKEDEAGPGFDTFHSTRSSGHSGAIRFTNITSVSTGLQRCAERFLPAAVTLLRTNRENYPVAVEMISRSNNPNEKKVVEPVLGLQGGDEIRDMFAAVRQEGGACIISAFVLYEDANGHYIHHKKAAIERDGRVRFICEKTAKINKRPNERYGFDSQDPMPMWGKRFNLIGSDHNTRTIGVNLSCD